MGGGGRQKAPKICHIYPTMMKLGSVIPYLKNIQQLYESRDTPLEKIATPAFLKIKFFLKKGYDVIIFVHDVTSKILSRDSNYNVNVVI